MLTQQPVVHRLLPLAIEQTEEPPPTGPLPIYEFEPSPRGCSQRAAAVVCGKQALPGAAGLGGIGDRGAAAGNEVGHR